MALTPAQLAALKAEIDADPVLAAKPLNSDGYFDTALILNNTIVTPDFFVWRTNVPINEVMGNGFDWVRVDNMTVGESRIWEYMTQLGFINPNQANVRAGINEAFKGVAADDSMRLAMYTNHLQKKATRTEKLFSSGAGTTSSNLGVGPATVTVTSITANDVEEARRLV